ANFSVERAARLVGLDFRKVETDDAFRMRTDFPLDDATAVVATVGTTSTTSVDPVPELARRCEGAGVWLHVDAAYAGAAAVCPELSWCLDGCERADSLVVNPHKWLFTPMDCSALFTQRPDLLKRAFRHIPDYLVVSEADSVTNLMDYGIALGRRFRALKLWFVIRSFGVDGLRSLVAEHIRIARRLVEEIDADPELERMVEVNFSTVVFRHRPAGLSGRALDDHNARVLEALLADREVY